MYTKCYLYACYTTAALKFSMGPSSVDAELRPNDSAEGSVRLGSTMYCYLFGQLNLGNIRCRYCARKRNFYHHIKL